MTAVKSDHGPSGQFTVLMASYGASLAEAIDLLASITPQTLERDDQAKHGLRTQTSVCTHR
ncbi:hypothetical protein VDGD_20341 [Verticillium dahliae]|nr:hypothetical protein VDGD_20341 [Verticillium dahliae]